MSESKSSPPELLVEEIATIAPEPTDTFLTSTLTTAVQQTRALTSSQQSLAEVRREPMLAPQKASFAERPAVSASSARLENELIGPRT